MKILPQLLVLAFAASSVHAAHHLEVESARYDLDGTTFESSIVFHSNTQRKLPGILMVPNWMGPTDASLEKAKKVAKMGYHVMMVDMYGVDTRPSNSQEASSAAGFVRGNRALMRERAQKALEVFKSEGMGKALDSNRLAAIGFCFGGGTVLELGRSGIDIDAVVSFHGDLASPTLEDDAAETNAKVLVLHGADDPYVPQEDVQQFVEVMMGTTVDWQLIQFGNTVHSFTNPAANSDGARYNAQSSERAFEAMQRLFSEIWGD